MNRYYCTNFTGHWSVPVAALVMAYDQAQAAYQLNYALRNHGLEGDAKPEDMMIWTDDEVIILSDGNY